MIYEVLAQSVGVLAMIAGIVSYQMNTHKRIMILKAACEGLFAVHFLMLAIYRDGSAYSGSVMNLIGAVRNVVFLFCVEKNKPVIPPILIFSAAMVACCAFTWRGAISLLAVGGKLCTTIAYAVKKPKFVRLLTIPSCIMWIIYDSVVLSVPGIMIEFFGLVSIIIGYLRYDLKNDFTQKHADRKRYFGNFGRKQAKRQQARGFGRNPRKRHDRRN